jgi:hypothetical protein
MKLPVNSAGAIMVKNITHLSYHVVIIFLSAALALSMPALVSAMAGKLLASWAFIENEKIFLAALEIATAVMLILFFNLVRRAGSERRLARMAKSAGLVQATPFRGTFIYKRRVKHMKQKLGFAREIMIIGSTGYRSFVEPEGDLHEAVQNCREARIMLLDPLKHGAIVRARSIPDPEITPEVIREQIIKSIDYLKSLKAAQKNVRLKLYPDMPLLKLAILGDYAFIRHYHTGLNVRSMPEFAFRNEQRHGGLYLPLYRYFLSRWQAADIPEYDLLTDELVYRDPSGSELRREPFNEITLTFDAGRKTLEDHVLQYVLR